MCNNVSSKWGAKVAKMVLSSMRDFRELYFPKIAKLHVLERFFFLAVDD